MNKESIPLPQNKNHKSAKTNKNAIINQRNKWTTKALEHAMDAMERRITSLKKTNQFWNIPFT
jgi:hypothetical protein